MSGDVANGALECLFLPCVAVEKLEECLPDWMSGTRAKVAEKVAKVAAAIFCGFLATCVCLAFALGLGATAAVLFTVGDTDSAGHRWGGATCAVMALYCCIMAVIHPVATAIGCFGSDRDMLMLMAATRGNNVGVTYKV